MILRILKPATMVGVGTFPPGTVVNIPRTIAESWINAGIARFYDGSPFVVPVELRVVPEGMFWCEEHQCLHRINSKPGKACLKRLEKEAIVEEEEETEEEDEEEEEEEEEGEG